MVSDGSNEGRTFVDDPDASDAPPQANREEADAVVHIVRHLQEGGEDMAGVGVVTPYSAQVERGRDGGFTRYGVQGPRSLLSLTTYPTSSVCVCVLDVCRFCINPILCLTL